MAGAVGSGYGDAVGVGLARCKLVMGAAHGVGPLAVGADAEAAVAVAASHAALGDEQAAAVNVCGAERAAGCLGDVGLGQAGSAGAADDGCVVGAGDGKGQAGRGGGLAVADAISDRNLGRLASCQGLEAGVTWVNRETVILAVVADAARQVLGQVDHAEHGTGIHITGVGECVDRCRSSVFQQAPCNNAARDHRRVVHRRKTQLLDCSSDTAMAIQNVVSQVNGTVVAFGRNDRVGAVAVILDGAMVRDWHADAQAVAFHIAVALEQLRGSKAVDRVFRACSQRGRLSRQRRRVVDAAQTDRLGCCDDPAVTVYHAVAQLERTVVVLCRGDRESAVTVVFDAAVVHAQITDAQAVVFNVAVTFKQVLRFDGVDRVFCACGQHGADAGARRCIIDSIDDNGLGSVRAATLPVHHFIVQGDGAVVVGVGCDGVAAVGIGHDRGVLRQDVVHGQGAAIDIAVTGQQLLCRHGVRGVLQTRRQAGRCIRQDGRFVG